jgi:nucleoside-diphosphate-sugar epimerase
MKVFVAGATGVLGRPLVRALVAAGHEVVGTTRTPAKVNAIEADGAKGVLCEALDRDAVFAAVTSAQPDVVVHQLTDLPDRITRMRKSREATNRLRREGTRYLVDAAKEAGARRVVAESIAFLYAPTGPGIADEDAPVWGSAPEPYGSMIGALIDLENTVIGTPGIEGVVLRYGVLYGPGTWYARDGSMANLVRKRRLPIVGDGAGLSSFLHVDDAARATLAALEHGSQGIYNIVDDAPVTYREHLTELAKLLGAKPPHRVPVRLVRLLPASGIAASVMTEQRGASNGKAKRELGWAPQYRTWRDGFRAEFSAAR